MDFNATSPFSFLPYSHVHHIVYETRPDRFYLLPASLDLVIRPFLNRLLLRYVKQLKLNSFFLVQPKNLLKQQSKQRKSELNGSRPEEHTSELQSLMRISYAVFCLKKKNNKKTIIKNNKNTQYIKITK